MKRFLIFSYDQYYPGGGWGDFKGAADTIEEARTVAATLKDDFIEIVDLETLKEVVEAIGSLPWRIKT